MWCDRTALEQPCWTSWVTYQSRTAGSGTLFSRTMLPPDGIAQQPVLGTSRRASTCETWDDSTASALANLSKGCGEVAHRFEPPRSAGKTQASGSGLNRPARDVAAQVLASSTC